MNAVAYLLRLYFLLCSKASGSFRPRFGFLLMLMAIFAPQVYGACTSYSYDALSRISTVTYSDGSVITYTYDNAGNRLGQTISGGAATPPRFTSTNKTTFSVGLAGKFTVTATGNPTPGFSVTGLPSWAALNSTNGVLSGTPPNTNGAPLTLTLTATNGVLPNATQTFTLAVVNPKPNLSKPNLSGGEFQMLVTGVAGQNYTVQTTTNLVPSNWSTLLVTNAPGTSFEFIYPNSTNRSRFYRVMVGP